MHLADAWCIERLNLDGKELSLVPRLIIRDNKLHKLCRVTMMNKPRPKHSSNLAVYLLKDTKVVTSWVVRWAPQRFSIINKPNFKRFTELLFTGHEVKLIRVLVIIKPSDSKGKKPTIPQLTKGALSRNVIDHMECQQKKYMMLPMPAGEYEICPNINSFLHGVTINKWW